MRKCCSHKCQTVCGSVTIVGGVLLLVAGLAIYFEMDDIIKLGVDQQVPLLKGRWSTSVWEDPQFDVQMAFWFFNFTNVEDYLAGRTDKPNLTQVGPYIFKEVQSKSQIPPVWSEKDTRVFYYNNHTYYYLSGNFDDEILHLNIPLITVLSVVDGLLGAFAKYPVIENFVQQLIQALDGSEGYVKKSVRELLYEGYEDNLFSLVTTLKNLCKTQLGVLLGGICDSIPDVPARMGFFYGKNATADGTYLIDSGKKAVENVGKIYLWNGAPELPVEWWHTEQARMLNGTDGTLNPTFIERHDENGNPTKLPLYVSDICRSLYVQYVKDTTVAVPNSKRKLDGYLFSVPAEVFSAESDENRGFCQPTIQYYSECVKAAGITTSSDCCLPNGMLSLSSCQFGAPVVVTSPHFMFCSQEVFDSVEGLVANDEDHQTSVIVEPTVGLGMYFARKLQLNVALSYNKTNRGTGPFSKVIKPLIIPALWLNESGSLDETTGNELYDQVVGQQQLLKILTYVLMAVGPLMILLAIGLLTYRFYRNNDNVTTSM